MSVGGGDEMLQFIATVLEQETKVYTVTGETILKILLALLNKDSQRIAEATTAQQERNAINNSFARSIVGSDDEIEKGKVPGLAGEGNKYAVVVPTAKMNHFVHEVKNLGGKDYRAIPMKDALSYIVVFDEANLSFFSNALKACGITPSADNTLVLPKSAINSSREAMLNYELEIEKQIERQLNEEKIHPKQLKAVTGINGDVDLTKEQINSISDRAEKFSSEILSPDGFGAKIDTVNFTQPLRERTTGNHDSRLKPESARGLKDTSKIVNPENKRSENNKAETPTDQRTTMTSFSRNNLQRNNRRERFLSPSKDITMVMTPPNLSALVLPYANTIANALVPRNEIVVLDVAKLPDTLIPKDAAIVNQNGINCISLRKEEVMEIFKRAQEEGIEVGALSSAVVGENGEAIKKDLYMLATNAVAEKAEKQAERKLPLAEQTKNAIKNYELTREKMKQTQSAGQTVGTKSMPSLHSL